MQTITIDSVSECNKMWGIETLHPLVQVVDFGKHPTLSQAREPHRIRYNIYVIFLKDTKSCGIRYGHQYYDYEEGTLVFISPGQEVEIHPSPQAEPPKGWALTFHPDLLYGTSLRRKIEQYDFFSYSVHEALHMSEREQKTIVHALEEIAHELEHAIDSHSKHIITSHIEVLLGHSHRFYDRQFTTREAPNSALLKLFDERLDQYLSSELPGQIGQPTVSYFADMLHLSPSYFGELVRKHTGKTAQEYIQLALVEKAKQMLETSTLNISEIAYQLGFSYPNHFTRLFRSKVGMPPLQWRASRA